MNLREFINNEIKGSVLKYDYFEIDKSKIKIKELTQKIYIVGDKND
ncbi:hypothetical protein [Sulfurimonas autotrophica]|uniref:Uncharacterized protein n=1 Tax=Sulfurimonas autotrophica (strain ATCC BAA-671 / DSM 16294 / JCM 11897 / OK10) TaxID=563040 RepID=E0URF8_SULAO|nr:hypothetical protein [Sulfurimonas autotrophica]ADN10044.1 hypothetical protein Saut_2001 [Sulfurimonas autotrophica DSM 16294]